MESEAYECVKARFEMILSSAHPVHSFPLIKLSEVKECPPNVPCKIANHVYATRLPKKKNEPVKALIEFRRKNAVLRTHKVDTDILLILNNGALEGVDNIAKFERLKPRRIKALKKTVASVEFLEPEPLVK